MSEETPRRTVRIEDGLWSEAKDKAQQRGDTLSEVIRTGLTNYVNEEAA